MGSLKPIHSTPESRKSFFNVLHWPAEGLLLCMSWKVIQILAQEWLYQLVWKQKEQLKTTLKLFEHVPGKAANFSVTCQHGGGKTNEELNQQAVKQQRHGGTLL